MGMTDLGRAALVGAAVAASPTASFAQCERDSTMAGDASAIQQLGYAVALDGAYAVLGAPGDDDQGTLAGAAYVFAIDADGMLEQRQKLLAPSGAESDLFGLSVALRGGWLVAGAPQLPPDMGYAVIYREDDGTWIMDGAVGPCGAPAGAQFGSSVAIESTWAAIGAPGDDEGGIDAGAVHLFEHTGSRWIERAKIVGPAGTDARFGQAVALSGTTLVTGAPGGAGKIGSSGAAFVYDFDGTAWSLTQELVPGDLEVTDEFGTSVALDGAVALVGAPGANEPAFETGAAYAFALVTKSMTWELEERLVPADAAESQRFGTSVAVAQDRALIGVGTDSDAGENAGAAYFYRRGSDDGGTGHWGEIRKLTASDAEEGAYFGLATALDPQRGMIGAPLDSTGGLFAGTAYIIDAETGAVEFGFDGSAPLTAEIVVPGMAPQFADVALSGSLTTMLDRDCACLSGAHAPSMQLSGQDAITIALPNGDEVEITDLQIVTEDSGPPVPVACDGTGEFIDYDIGVDADAGTGARRTRVGGLACLFGIFDLGPGAELSIEFPIQLTFEMDLDLGDLDPLVTVTGTLIGYTSPPQCPIDLDGSGSVDIGDLLIVLSAWGEAGGDVTGDGVTDVADLLVVLAQWGPC